MGGSFVCSRNLAQVGKPTSRPTLQKRSTTQNLTVKRGPEGLGALIQESDGNCRDGSEIPFPEVLIRKGTESGQGE